MLAEVAYPDECPPSVLLGEPQRHQGRERLSSVTSSTTSVLPSVIVERSGILRS